MKIVVQLPPDQAELVLNELEKEDFIVDQQAYCHFRDEIFINEIKRFIKQVAPGKWKEMDHLENGEKVNAWYDNQDMIYKYYRRFKRRQQTFYQHNNDIYCYKLIGFINVGNEIQLMKLEPEDVVELLNKSDESIVKRLLRKIGIA